MCAYTHITGLARLRLGGKESMNAIEKVTQPRDRLNPIRVYVNSEERDLIKAKARAAGMTISHYTRAAVMMRPIKSAFDADAIHALSKVNADQGRLGGLLKMYLTDGDTAGTVARALLDQMKQVQRDLAEAATKVK